MKNKIFQIGFNKCATTSIHALFLESGYESVHWDNGKLAKQLYINLSSGRNILTGYSQYHVFTDMEDAENLIFGHRFYKHIFAQYPYSYFILNTRDKGQWLSSRCNHWDGWLLDIMWQKFGFDRCTTINYWSEEWDYHHRDVRNFFRASKRFLEFNIDIDPVEKLIGFVQPEYKIKAEFWKHHNQSSRNE